MHTCPASSHVTSNPKDKIELDIWVPQSRGKEYLDHQSQTYSSLKVARRIRELDFASQRYLYLVKPTREGRTCHRIWPAWWSWEQHSWAPAALRHPQSVDVIAGSRLASAVSVLVPDNHRCLGLNLQWLVYFNALRQNHVCHDRINWLSSEITPVLLVGHLSDIV